MGHKKTTPIPLLCKGWNTYHAIHDESKLKIWLPQTGNEIWKRDEKEFQNCHKGVPMHCLFDALKDQAYILSRFGKVYGLVERAIHEK